MLQLDWVQISHENGSAIRCPDMQGPFLWAGAAECALINVQVRERESDNMLFT